MEFLKKRKIKIIHNQLRRLVIEFNAKCDNKTIITKKKSIMINFTNEREIIFFFDNQVSLFFFERGSIDHSLICK